MLLPDAGELIAGGICCWHNGQRYWIQHDTKHPVEYLYLQVNILRAQLGNPGDFKWKKYPYPPKEEACRRPPSDAKTEYAGR